MEIAPALAAGCTMVVKPAPETPLTALKLAELCHEAGVPEGVVNVLPGLDEAGKALVRHPGVPKIAFTGETATGRHILQAAAPHIKRVTLELGGKSPNVIFADADLEQAAKSALFGVFYNSGQVCQAGSRILVERTVYEPFVERLAERAKKLKVGPGTNARSDLGPVISQEQYEKVLRYIEIGKQEGARLAAGGRALDGLGAAISSNRLCLPMYRHQCASPVKKFSARWRRSFRLTMRKKRSASPTGRCTVWRPRCGRTTLSGRSVSPSG
ncbi:Betaine aldehyde dehydrogenase [Geobacillus sp. BCO2]|nr:Betaine aldehyde dehydrogenase [Geobacillus sp. BCO2]